MIAEIRKAITCRIITVTLNPVFDRSLLVPGFRPGGTFIVEDSTMLPAGKGVNVSRSLRNVSIDSIVSGILPRGGSEIYRGLLEKDRLQHDFILTEGLIRTNVTIVHSGGETHLREKSHPIDRSTLNRFKKKLLALIDGDTTFVFSGSLPDGLPADTYSQLIDTARQKGCPVFLDASGIPLRRAVASRPWFVKPNLKEVRDALGYFPGSIEDLEQACGDFHNLGIENVMITMGKEGVILSRKGEIVSAGVEVPRPVNAVGSGDAAASGAIIGTLGGLDTVSVARLACAFGGANTLVSGAGLFRVQDLERLYSSAEVLTLR